MEFTSYLRHVRIAPRKFRYSVELIRGLNVEEASAILKTTPLRGASIVYRALQSAKANADYVATQKRLDLDPDTLIVKVAVVDNGPTMKRWTAAPQGRAMPIKKRFSHLTLVLAQPPEKEEDKPKRGRPKGAKDLLPESVAALAKEEADKKKAAAEARKAKKGEAKKTEAKKSDAGKNPETPKK